MHKYRTNNENQSFLNVQQEIAVNLCLKSAFEGDRLADRVISLAPSVGLALALSIQSEQPSRHTLKVVSPTEVLSDNG
ncbi:MAG: hypothetical protein AB8B99_08700 [Phormidesmis sp.]